MDRVFIPFLIILIGSSDFYGSNTQITTQSFFGKGNSCLLLEDAFEHAIASFVTVNQSPLHNIKDKKKHLPAVIVDIFKRIEWLKRDGISLNEFDQTNNLLSCYLIRLTSTLITTIAIKRLIHTSLTQTGQVTVSSLKHTTMYAQFLKQFLALMKKHSLIVELNPKVIRNIINNEFDAINNYFYFKQSYFEISSEFEQLKKQLLKLESTLLRLEKKQRQLNEHEEQNSELVTQNDTLLARITYLHSKHTTLITEHQKLKALFDEKTSQKKS